MRVWHRRVSARSYVFGRSSLGFSPPAHRIRRIVLTMEESRPNAGYARGNDEILRCALNDESCATRCNGG